MTLALILVTEGMKASEAGPCFADLRDLLFPGDQLIVTNSESDADLSLVLADIAEPEFFAEGVNLTLLCFGNNPTANRWVQANAAMVEADRAILLTLFSGQMPPPEALAAARAKMAASGADLLLAGGLAPALARADWLMQIPARDPAPLLIRRNWLQRKALRLAETGAAPDLIRHWQLCAAAGMVAWSPEPLGVALPPVLPRDGDCLLAIHSTLATMSPGLEEPALGWLIEAMDRTIPTLQQHFRWTLAMQLAGLFASFPERRWQAVIARLRLSRAAAIAAMLRRGAVLEVISLFANEAAEARLVALAGELSTLQDTMSALQRNVESLCRLAEYDALAARWSERDDGSVP